MREIMNKNLIGVILGIIIVAGGAFAFAMQSDTDSKTSEQSQTETADVMEKNDSEEAMKKDGDETMDKTEDEAMMKKTVTYVELADFDANKDTYDNQTKVYFFHASWCPICKSIDEDITSDPTQIPSNTTLIKADFDTSTELRQKYGVTTQYTFVKVDNDGNEISQWSATSLDKAIAGIES